MIAVRIIEVRMRVIKTSENKLLEVAFISLIRSGSVDPVTRVRTEDLIEKIGVNPSANLLQQFADRFNREHPFNKGRIIHDILFSCRSRAVAVPDSGEDEEKHDDANEIVHGESRESLGEGKDTALVPAAGQSKTSENQ